MSEVPVNPIGCIPLKEWVSRRVDETLAAIERYRQWRDGLPDDSTEEVNRARRRADDAIERWLDEIEQLRSLYT